MPTRTRSRHYVKPSCRFKCRFIQITDELWLCPHASFGAASYKLGAVEEARRLLEQAGGYDQVLGKILAEEAEARAERDDAREKARRIAAASVRYD
jgi:hypothetical protein